MSLVLLDLGLGIMGKGTSVSCAPRKSFCLEKTCAVKTVSGKTSGLKMMSSGTPPGNSGKSGSRGTIAGGNISGDTLRK